jgi:hypothetical protein
MPRDGCSEGLVANLRSFLERFNTRLSGAGAALKRRAPEGLAS